MAEEEDMSWWFAAMYVDFLIVKTSVRVEGGVLFDCYPHKAERPIYGTLNEYGHFLFKYAVDRR